MTEAFQEFVPGNPDPGMYPPLRLAAVGGIATGHEAGDDLEVETTPQAELPQPNQSLRALGEVALSDNQLRVQRDFLSLFPAQGMTYTDARKEANALSAAELHERLSQVRKVFDYGASVLTPSQRKRRSINDTDHLLNQLSQGLSPQVIMEQNGWSPTVYKTREKSLHGFLVQVRPAYDSNADKPMPSVVNQTDYRSPEARYEREDQAAKKAQRVTQAIRIELRSGRRVLGSGRDSRLMADVEERLTGIRLLRDTYGDGLVHEPQYHASAAKFLYMLSHHEREGSGQKNSQLVTRIATEQFLEDVRAYETAGIHQPDVAAFYYGSDVLKTIQKVYPGLPPSALGSLFRRCRSAKLSVVIAAAGREAKRVELSDEEIERGEENLNRIRFIREVTGWKNYRKTPSWRERDFMRYVQANSHLAAGVVGVESAVRFIVSLAQRCNEAHEAAGYNPPIPTDPASLLSIFGAYAASVEQFRQRIPQREAEAYARTLSFQEYEQLIETYGELIDMSEDQLLKMIGLATASPELKLQSLLQAQQELRLSFKDSIEAVDIKRILITSRGNLARAMEHARLYTDGFEDVWSSLSGQHSWLEKSRAKAFFLGSSQPIEELSEWAKNVSEALKKWAGNPYVTSPSAAWLMEVNKGKSVEEVMNGYLLRIEHMVAERRRHSLPIPNSYLIRWAIRAPESYANVFEKHIKVHAMFAEHLRAAGEDIGEEIISKLAFRWSDPVKVEVRVRQFLANRAYLRRVHEFNASIEGSMIDFAAINSSLKSAQNALTWVSYADAINKRTADRATVMVSRDDGEQYDRRTNMSMPDSSATHQGTDSSLEAVYDCLDSLSAAAVKVVFGLSSEYDEQQLADELGVPDLEEYVHTVILPKIQQGMVNND